MNHPRHASLISILAPALFALLAVQPVACLGADADETFQRANAHYEQGDYETAAQLYRELLNDGTRSPALFYNLGNAHYRLGEPGRALLNYRRALILDPDHAEASHNEAFLRASLPEVPRSESQAERWFRILPPTLLLPVASAAFWIVLALAGLVLLKGMRPQTAVGLILSALVFTYALTGFLILRSQTDLDKLAMVIEEGVKARYAPATTSGTLLPLPQGTVLRILGSNGNWTYAELPDRSRGWLMQENLESLLPEPS